MNWNDLRFLIAISRRGSLAGAAKDLGVTKATASRRIAALEEDLGTRLVERTRDGYVLTPAGEAAIATAETMERAAAQLEALAKSAADAEPEGLVRLTCPSWLADPLLVPALGGLRDRHPKLRVELLGTNEVLNLAKHEADVGLRNVRPSQASVVVRKIGELSIRLYASALYLERHPRPMSRPDIDDHALVQYKHGGTMPGFDWMAGSKGATAFRATDPAGLAAAVASGLGVGAIPSLIARAHDGLIALNELGVGHGELLVVYREADRELGRIRAVVDWIEETFVAAGVMATARV